MMIVLTWTWAFVFLTMPYSVIPIVAMLTYQSACGCVCQSVWECLITCFFIISYSNIVINTQTFRYLVGYLPVKPTKELLENQRNVKSNTSIKSIFTEFQLTWCGSRNTMKSQIPLEGPLWRYFDLLECARTYLPHYQQFNMVSEGSLGFSPLHQVDNPIMRRLPPNK